MDSLLNEPDRGPHVDHFRSAGVADGPGSAHEEYAARVDAQSGIVDPGVVILRPVKHNSTALEAFRVMRIREVPIAEFFGNHARLHDGGIEQVAPQYEEARLVGQRPLERSDHGLVENLCSSTILTDRASVDGRRL